MLNINRNNQLNKITTGLLMLSTASLSVLSISNSVSAFTIGGTSTNPTININKTADINKSFQVFLDGNVDGAATTALNSNAIFKFLGTTTIGSGTSAKTEFNFDITVNNTTTLSSATKDYFQSRVSVLGFDLENFASADIVGVGNTNISGNTRATSGIFNKDANGQMANAGTKEVCFSTNNCAGGTDGGVNNFTGLTSGSVYKTGSFNATVVVKGNVSDLNMGNFGVRYQSINGRLGTSNVTGKSGTGKTKKIVDLSAPPPPRRVPESGILGAIALGFTGLLFSRKNR